MRNGLLILLLLSASTLSAQDPVDFRTAAHWTAGVQLAEGLTTPVILEDLIVVADGNGAIQRIKISDPDRPNVLTPLSLPEPVTCVRGPFSGYVYASGTDHLFVLDATSLELAATLDHRQVTDLVLTETVGALLASGGDSLIMVDPSQPLTLPMLANLDLNPRVVDMEQVALHDHYLLLTKSSFGMAAAIDISDPANPTFVCKFGEAYFGGKRTVTRYVFTVYAFATDHVYTLEHGLRCDSHEVPYHVYYDGRIARWDFADPEHPVVLTENYPATHWIDGISHHCLVEPERAVVAMGSRLVAIDLQAPELDHSAVLTGLGAGRRICGLAHGQGLLAAAAEDGTLHLFRDRQPDGPPTTSFDGGDYWLADLCRGRFMTVRTRASGDEVHMYIKAFDSSDPANQALIYDSELLSANGKVGCAVAPHCTVVFGTSMSVFDLESGTGYYVHRPAHDFEFITRELGVAVNDEGLQILDTTTPGAFTDRARPWEEACVEVTPIPRAPGAHLLVATRDEASLVRIWNLDDPEAPTLRSALQTELDALVDVRGGPDPILVGIHEDRPGWPGATLQLFVDIDTATPRPAGHLALPGRPRNGYLDGTLLYLACESAGLVVVDVSDPDAPRIHGGFGTDPIHAVQMDRGCLQVAGSHLFPLIPAITGYQEIDLIELAIVPATDGFDLSWQALGDWSQVESRLTAVHASGTRTLPVTMNGSTCSAHDDAADWGQTTYQIAYREFAHQSWIILAEQAVWLTEPELPTTTRILPPAPNPFNAHVTLTCETVAEGMIDIRICDLAGRIVRRLVSAHHLPGRHAFTWDGCNQNGQALPSGTYIVDVQAGDVAERQKIQLVR